jgi:hypothetical protein
MQRQGAKNRHSNARTPAETKIRGANARRDQNPGIEWPKIPAETPYLAPTWKRAVCGDWMVGVIGIELVTPSLFELKTYDQNVFAP